MSAFENDYSTNFENDYPPSEQPYTSTPVSYWESRAREAEHDLEIALEELRKQNTDPNCECPLCVTEIVDRDYLVTATVQFVVRGQDVTEAIIKANDQIDDLFANSDYPNETNNRSIVDDVREW